MLTDLDNINKQLKIYRDNNAKIVVTSGGFDSIHLGHIRHLKEAAKLGDCLIVIVNSDRYIKSKKGYIIYPLDVRMEIVDAIKGVDFVLTFDAKNRNDVSGAIDKIRPDIFARGGDATGNEERYICDRIGCSIITEVGGSDKLFSSSNLVYR